MPIHMFLIMTLILIFSVSLIYLVFRDKFKNSISKGSIGILLGIIPFTLLIIGTSTGFLICPIPEIILGIFAEKEKDKKGRIAIILGVLNIILGIYIHMI